MLDTGSFISARLNSMFGTPSAEEYTHQTMRQLIIEKVRETETALARHLEDANSCNCRGASSYSELCMQGKLALTMDAGALGMSVKQFLAEPR